jgi:HSP20 family protein
MKRDYLYEHSLYEEIQSMSLNSTHWRLRMRSSAWRPPTDVYETEETIVIRVEIGGMREDDFDVELEGRVLSIKGNRHDIPEQRGYHQVEIRFGEFYIEIHLPAPVDARGVTADYDNGFLLVTLPKARSRQIQIED